MSYRSYLSRSETGSFHFRIRLPSAASQVLGLREIRRGLGTRDRLEAQRRALDLYQAVLSLQKDPSEVPALLRKRVREKASQSLQKALGTSNRHQLGVDHYYRHNAHLWTAKTAQEVRSIIDRLPVGKGFGKAEAVVHKTSLEGLDPKTQNKHLARLKSLFDFLIDHDYYSLANPFNRLRVPMRKGKRPEEGRTVWSVEDCRKLAEMGEWLALQGLCTGARINELAQLRIADISDRIRITDEREGQRLKNSASRRDVPIHPELKRRGFLQLVENRKSAGHDRLFDFPLGRDGYGQAASRWFNRYRAKHGFVRDFHSLRHTVATRLRNAEVPEDVVAELLGHSKGQTMSFSRYAKGSSWERLERALAKLTY
ncbi:MAG: tyrosine-type recombinase/integrase [Nitrospira sp.]